MSTLPELLEEMRVSLDSLAEAIGAQSRAFERRIAAERVFVDAMEEAVNKALEGMA